tara:strand:+ start:658 stop:1182 length:525 start_codon:yes stop_codon:yes gene_type:complete
MAFFWSDVNSQPKRRYRFTLSISKKGNDNQIPLWTIKTAAKPKANISTVEHQFIDHVFKFPGRVTWDPIQVTLVDPVDPDLSAQFLDVLIQSGYRFPTDASKAQYSLSKKKFYDQIGEVYINQIDEDGTTIEKWALKNAFFTSVDFGGTLDYSSDEMQEITVEITFDWAERINP